MKNIPIMSCLKGKYEGKQTLTHQVHDTAIDQLFRCIYPSIAYHYVCQERGVHQLTQGPPKFPTQKI